MSTANLSISGNVTQTPELTFTASGVARLAFSVAVNYNYTDQSGEKQEKVSFFNVTAWRYLAENSAAVLEKGIGVVVTGRLEQRTYEKDGEKKSAVDLIADEIGIATRSIEGVTRRQAQAGGGQKSAPRPQNSAAPRTRPAVATGNEVDEPF
jgi:single-strand DNA-binding protein